MVVGNLIRERTLGLVNHFLFIGLVKEQPFGGNQIHFRFGVKMNERNNRSFEKRMGSHRSGDRDEIFCLGIEDTKSLFRRNPQISVIAQKVVYGDKR